MQFRALKLILTLSNWASFQGLRSFSPCIRKKGLIPVIINNGDIDGLKTKESIVTSAVNT